MTYRLDEELLEQVPKEHGDMNNGEQVNDYIEDDGTNTLIHDSFNVRMDGDDDDNHEIIDDFDDVHDLDLLEKTYKPIYEGSNKNIISCILMLIMYLMVMNGLSNI